MPVSKSLHIKDDQVQSLYCNFHFVLRFALHTKTELNIRVGTSFIRIKSNLPRKASKLTATTG